MGTVTKTIGTAARDYSTIAAWAAALPANLVTDGNSYVGQCFNDSEFTVTAQIAWTSTTDSTHFVTLTTGAGQSFRDNVNVRTNALTYDQSKGVGIKATAFLGGDGGIISSNALSSFSVISNLQLNANGNATGIGASSNIGGGNSTIDNLLIHFGSNYACTGGISLGDHVKVRNCFLKYTGTTSPTRNWINLNHGGSTGSEIDFCTLVLPSNVTAKGTAIRCQYGTVTVENTAAFGMVSLTTGAGTVTATTCHTDIASPPAGWTQKTYNNSYFVDTTADWRLAASSPAQGAGTSDSTNGATDISALARPQGSNWDIGCWELAVAAARGLFRQNPMTGLGAGGPFFSNPLG